MADLLNLRHSTRFQQCKLSSCVRVLLKTWLGGVCLIISRANDRSNEVPSAFLVGCREFLEIPPEIVEKGC